MEEARVRHLNKLGMHKSWDPGVLRELPDVMARPLSIIFGQSWQRVLRTERKQTSLASSRRARRRDAGNYRLVGLTLTPGKVMEQVMLETVPEHTEDKKVIGSSQRGFMKGKSCVSNLTDFNKIICSVDKGRAMGDIALTLGRLSALFPITSSWTN